MYYVIESKPSIAWQLQIKNKLKSTFNARWMRKYIIITRKCENLKMLRSFVTILKSLKHFSFFLWNVKRHSKIREKERTVFLERFSCNSFLSGWQKKWFFFSLESKFLNKSVRTFGRTEREKLIMKWDLWSGEGSVWN